MPHGPTTKSKHRFSRKEISGNSKSFLKNEIIEKNNIYQNKILKHSFDDLNWFLKFILNSFLIGLLLVLPTFWRFEMVGTS